MSSRRLAAALAVLTVAVLGSGCALMKPAEVVTLPELAPAEAALAEEIGLEADRLRELKAKPIYRFSEAELHDYLRFVSKAEPDLKSRIVHYGRKNIGQPYELYLLGEFPFETYDPQPLYELRKSDCVVFSEHTYAMALSHDWPSFFAMLQRIRYHEGRIGVATRNHYTEAQWNRNNSWLVHDVTEELGGDNVERFTQKLDVSKFLKKRYKLDSDYEPYSIEESYIPYQHIAAIEDRLTEGSYVNIIRGPDKNNVWAGHVGLVTRSADGTANLLHSAQPSVKEQPIQEYIELSLKRNEEKMARYEEKLAEWEAWRAANPELDADTGDGEVREILTEDEAHGRVKPVEKMKKPSKPALFFGFKFLELREDPLANLRDIDGPAAPIVRPPDGSRI